MCEADVLCQMCHNCLLHVVFQEPPVRRDSRSNPPVHHEFLEIKFLYIQAKCWPGKLVRVVARACTRVVCTRKVRLHTSEAVF